MLKAPKWDSIFLLEPQTAVICYVPIWNGLKVLIPKHLWKVKLDLWNRFKLLLLAMLLFLFPPVLISSLTQSLVTSWGGLNIFKSMKRGTERFPMIFNLSNDLSTSMTWSLDENLIWCAIFEVTLAYNDICTGNGNDIKQSEHLKYGLGLCIHLDTLLAQFFGTEFSRL